MTSAGEPEGEPGSPPPEASPPSGPPPAPDEGPAPQAAPAEPPAPTAPPTEPAGPPAHPWWRRAVVHEDEPWSHLARSMAYEVTVVFVTAVAVAVLAFVGLQGEFQDVYVKLRPRTVPSGEVALLTLGPQAFYTWNPAEPVPVTTPRALVAQLVRFLDAAGADVIVLDLLLDQPAPGDDELAAAARDHGAVLAAERLELTEPARGLVFAAGITPALEGAVHTGFANFQVEQSTLFSDAQLVRKVPLVAIADRAHLVGPWPGNLVGATQDTDAVVPSLSLYAAWLHRAHTDPYVAPTVLPERLAAACHGPVLTCDLDLPALGLPPAPTPLTEPLRINFRGPERADGIPTVPASRALGVMAETALLQSLGAEATIAVPEDLRRVFEGRVVVVGRVDRMGTPDADRFVTPYALPLLATADMAGARVHAQVIDTLLSGRHLRTVGGGWAWVVAVLLAVAVRVTHTWLRDDVFLAAWLVTAVALVAVGLETFDLTDGVALQIGPPLGAILFMLVFLLVRSWAVEESART